MVDGAVLHAVAFIGGNYCARVLSGDDPKAAQEEKFGTTKSLRPTRRPMPNIKGQMNQNYDIFSFYLIVVQCVD